MPHGIPRKIGFLTSIALWDPFWGAFYRRLAAENSGNQPLGCHCGIKTVRDDVRSDLLPWPDHAQLADKRSIRQQHKVLPHKI